MSLDVRAIMENESVNEPVAVDYTKHRFVEDKPEPIYNAMRRIEALKGTTRNLKEEVNRTDTNVMSEMLKVKYDLLLDSINAVIDEELELVRKGV